MTPLAAALWLGVSVHSLAQYTACRPGVYGRQCDGVCSCQPYEDCDDGVVGTGLCTCQAGREAECGEEDEAPVGPEAGVGMGKAADLVFVNRTLSTLRVDAETSRMSRQVFNASVSRARPQPFRGPARLALVNAAAARRLGLDANDKAGLTALFSGVELPRRAQPFCHAYGGHQFGSWSGQLGDGRAMSLGEVLGFAPSQAPGEEDARWWPWELTLKGAGKTPYSRGSDGRATLANAAREFLAPIFLEAAGVPVASTVAVLGSDFEEDRIIRDEWYSGEAAFKKPGITVRSMPSFLRFGSLQLAAKRQGLSGVETIARYVLAAVARMEAHDDAATAYLDQLPVTVPPELRARCFYGKLPEASCAAQAQSLPRAELLRCLLRRVTERTAALLAAWMAVGFAHGVMNTDNLSLLGITVDLNVFGFLSTYDPTWQPNYIDETARYAFGEQPDIARWNLQRLADALTGTSFVSDREPDAQLWPQRQPGEWMDRQEAAHILDRFNETFEVCRVARMELRLGFPATGRPCTADSPGPACLESRWRQWLTRARADYPRASRGLAEIGVGDAAAAAAKLASHAGAEGKDLDTLTALLGEFRALHGEKDFAAAVRAAVPSVSPRSHILREAARVVEMEKPGDTAAAFLSEVQRLLASPYDTRALDLDELEDDPREAWRNVNLAGPPPPDMPSLVKRRLYAIPKETLRHIQTSCGAQ